MSGNYVDIVTSWDYSRLAFLHSTDVVQVVDSEFTLISTIVFEDGPINYPKDSLHWFAIF